MGPPWKEGEIRRGRQSYFNRFVSFRSDRRGFKCVAYNVSEASDYSDSCSEGVAFVRVKDKYAALWPFLGIVAEVVVLLTVILVTFVVVAPQFLSIAEFILVHYSGRVHDLNSRHL